MALDREDIDLMTTVVKSVILDTVTPELNQINSKLATYHSEVLSVKSEQENNKEEIGHIRKKIKDYTAVKWIAYAVGSIAITVAATLLSGVFAGEVKQPPEEKDKPKEVVTSTKPDREFPSALVTKKP